MRRILRRTRVHLTLAYTAIVVVVAAVGATVFWFAFSGAELGSIDTGLARAQGRVLAGGILPVGGGFRFADPSSVAVPNTSGRIDGALLGGDGGVADETTPPPAAAVIREAAQAPRDGTARLSTVAGPNGGERVMARRLKLPGDGRGTLVVAESLAAYDDTVGRAAIFLGIAVGVVTLLAGASGYWLSGRALRPVREITGLARGLSEQTLDRRIGLDLPDDEIGRLAETFNAMLDRLQAAFDTLQRFTADAAHELRAPLAVVTTQVEVALQRARSGEEYRATLELVLAEIGRLSTRADQLLTLARADAGALRAHLQAVDVADLLEDTVDRWQPVAHDRGVSLATSLPASGTVDVDVDMLRRLVDNLLDNALRHTPEGGEVTVRARLDGQWWELAVEDSGEGVPAALRPRLFERFSRADASRGRDSGGAGLGLSICGVIARLHGGDIRLDEDRASRFVARFACRGEDGRRPADAGR